MSKYKRAGLPKVQTKEAMIKEIVKLLHNSSYLHIRAILCILQNWNENGDST